MNKMSNEEVICDNCEYWTPISKTPLGVCRRHAPQPSMVNIANKLDTDRVCQWPITDAWECCAEFKEAE